MPDVILSTIGGAGSQFFDNNGVPLAGGKLYTYEAGTTTPAATYTSSSGAVARSNPIVLDSAGRVPGDGVWLVYGSQYKIVLKDSADATISTWDDFPGDTQISAIAAVQAQVDATDAGIAAVANCFVRATRSLPEFTLTKNTTTKLPFNVEVTDLADNYDPSTYEFTTASAGVYLVSALGYFVAVAGTSYQYIEMQVFVNGTKFHVLCKNEVGTFTNDEQATINGSVPLYLASGDVVSVHAEIQSDQDWRFSDLRSSLTITRIS